MSLLVKMRPVHPGEVLREEFMEPLGLSAIDVAKRVGVPRTRIERLAGERVAVSSDTAVRLAKLFGTTPGFWLNLQTAYDLHGLEAVADEIEPLPRPQGDTAETALA